MERGAVCIMRHLTSSRAPLVVDPQAFSVSGIPPLPCCDEFLDPAGQQLQHTTENSSTARKTAVNKAATVLTLASDDTSSFKSQQQGALGDRPTGIQCFGYTPTALLSGSWTLQDNGCSTPQRTAARQTAVNTAAAVLLLTLASDALKALHRCKVSGYCRP
jgi:hypothetical protein